MDLESAGRNLERSVSVGIISDDPSRVEVLLPVIKELGWQAVTLSPTTSTEGPDKSIGLILVSIACVTNEGLELVSRAGLLRRGCVLVISDNRNPQIIADVLRSGADDYLASPFEPAELIARMRSLVTRVWPSMDRRVSDAIQFDLTTRSIVTGPYSVRFTPLEWEVLNILLEGDGAPLSPEAIAEDVQVSQVQPSTIPTVISRIRRRLASNNFEAISVTTVQNRGYAAQFRRSSDQRTSVPARDGDRPSSAASWNKSLTDEGRLGSRH